jgi:hypothetical protein
MVILCLKFIVAYKLTKDRLRGCYFCPTIHSVRQVSREVQRPLDSPHIESGNSRDFFYKTSRRVRSAGTPYGKDTGPARGKDGTGASETAGGYHLSVYLAALY